MIIGGNDSKRLSLDATIEKFDACYNCKGNCCKTKQVVIPLSDYEFEAIPKKLTAIFEGFPIMQRTDNGCNALTEKGCSIFDIRPFYCRMYPIKIVPVGKSDLWDSYHIDGFAFVLNHCGGREIDFATNIEKILKELEKDKVYFNRLYEVTRKYEELVIYFDDYAAYTLIE